MQHIKARATFFDEGFFCDWNRRRFGGNARFLSSVQGGWGQKSVGAAGERGDKSIRDADQSGGLVPVCSIGGSLDGEKNNTIGHQAAFVL